MYALADGPVAGALVAWQIAWQFASADHTVRCVPLREGVEAVQPCLRTHRTYPLAFNQSGSRARLARTVCSVLVHLLPGLAMAAHRHVRHGQSASGATSPAPALASRDAAAWLLAAPLAFYATWQAAYFLVVQVLVRRHIVSRKLDTSYRCLTRRAARSGNVWARLVLRGNTARRLAAYGLLQLAFTSEPSGRQPILRACKAWQPAGWEASHVAPDSKHGRPRDPSTLPATLPPRVLARSCHPAAFPANLLQPTPGMPLAGCQVFGAG